MADPATHEEYTARFHQNYKVEGFGVGNVFVNYPCPFCSAPGYMRCELLETQEVMKREHHCGECGRSGKAIFHIDTPEQTKFEIVQTGGPDIPSYLPQIRRVES